MKAIRLIQPGQPLEMHQLPLPAIGVNDVLVHVRAAGICHSDAHYRAGVSPVSPLPLTLGHEVAGIVEEIGSAVTSVEVGDRVCLHYLVTCGQCAYCLQGHEQFCTQGAMLGKHRDGGYAEYIALPARGVFHLPEPIPFEHGAILMCSSATAFHALVKARLQPGETVAVFGVGGLGLSAVQLAQAFGAREVYAVEIKSSKLALAARLGAIPVDAAHGDPVVAIRDMTAGRGVDVALELVGLPLTMDQAVRSLAIFGRAALVGISDRSFEVRPYHDVINREAEIIGVSDHLAQELPHLIDHVLQGKLDLSSAVTQTVPLDAATVNAVLDRLDAFADDVRVVIKP